MKKKLEEYLRNYKKTYITLDELMKLYKNRLDYNKFANIIKDIEKSRGIEPVKKSGFNNRAISLAYKYRVNKPYFRQNYYNRLHKKNLEINVQLSLEDYYALDESTFKKDEPYIDLVSKYLDKNPDMEEEKYMQQLSFELVGDEKWIQDKGGEKVLRRLHLWDKFLFYERIEPLAFAINQNRYNQNVHYHLIIENKTPFLYLMNIITESKYTTIIYGKGWQIISNIHLLSKQLNYKWDYVYEYFGDMDHEGLSIYDSLTKKINVKPANHFYEAMMKYNRVKGKDNQRINEVAIDNFISNFTSEQQEFIKKVLRDKTYYPQEILSESIMGKILKDDLDYGL